MPINEHKLHWRWMAGFAALWLLLAFTVDNEYTLRIMAVVMIWAIMGLSWNILSGYSGLVSFGHAAFFGLGGYFVVLAQIHWQISPWIGIPIAALIGAVSGLLIGIVTFRLRGHYFALAMLAYPLALLYVFEWLGYQEVTIPRVTENPAAYMQFHDGQMRIYVLIGLAAVMAVMIMSRFIERNRFGRSLLAIKQDETAAEAAGINTRAWKLRAIALSGAIAGAGGGLYAVVQLVVTPPSAFGILVSAQALTVVMFGGVGTVWGPLIGALSLVPLSAWLDAKFAEVLPGIQGVLYGIAIVIVVLAAPEGIFWRLRDYFVKYSAEKSTDDANSINSEAETDFTPRTTQSDAELLRVSGLTKSFGGLRAVDDVSFTVRRGEIVGLIGPNGAGKTTLFNLLNGFSRPDSGMITFGGQRIVGLAANQICRLGIGRTFQVVKPFRRMSILENVLVGAYVGTTDDKEAQLRAYDALNIVGLAEHANRNAGSISNEQLRLVELARALAGRPSLLLLDEIFAGLARDEVAALMDRIRELAALGITIVIIEHTMQAMVKLVDRFVVLDHGSVLAEGIPAEITKHPDVISAYLGKKWADNA